MRFGNDPLELSIYKYLIENAASESGWDKQELEWQSEDAATDCTSRECRSYFWLHMDQLKFEWSASSSESRTRYPGTYIGLST